MPSVVFAEASWYGSLRGGVEFGGGNDAAFKDGGSRWGIKGSSEISEGLSAVYRFEHKISTTDGGQPGGRLAYAGLSGGFGTITLGQIWNAAYNHVGSITDGSWFYGNSHTGYRHGNAVSYAYSGGALSLQLDAIMDGGMNTDSAVDKLEFGLTVDLGDIGKVAIAHTNVKDTMKSMTFITQEAMAAVDATYGWDNDSNETTAPVPVMMDTVTVAMGDETNVADGKLNADGAAAVVRAADGSLSVGTCDDEATDTTQHCTTATVFVYDSGGVETVPNGGGTVTTTRTIDYVHVDSVSVTELTPAMDAVAEESETRSVVDSAGKKTNHIAVQFGIGGVTTYLGHTKEKQNGASNEDTITHYGVSGGIGDTGVSFHAMGRNVEKASGSESSPWLVGFTKGLGGGATAMIEHANDDNDKSGKTRIGLKVDF